MPFARVHEVVVLSKSLTPEFKVTMHSYYVLKTYQARKEFQRQFPHRELMKVIDLGTVEVEFSKEKYHALYKDA
jgi:hypothetical protein